jgi:hypothetical protein
VGTGTLTAIQGSLTLENEPSFDTIVIDDSEDSAGRTFNMISIPGDTPGGLFTQIFGTALAGFIQWDNADASGVTLVGGSLGNTFNIKGTGVPTTIDGGSGANIFNVGVGDLSAEILNSLTIHGGSNAGTQMILSDTSDPNSETFNFAISQPGTGSLTLGSSLAFDLAFDGMNLVDLFSNGFSTVNDPSGTVDVVS